MVYTKQKTGKINTDIIRRPAVWIYRKTKRLFNTKAMCDRLRKIYVASDNDIREMCDEYYITRISAVIILLVLCMGLSGIIWIKEKKSDKSIIVEREAYGGDNSTVQLETEINDEEVSFDADVLAFYYEEADMPEIFNKGFEYIEGVYLNDNQSADNITSDLNLIDYIDELGLNVVWNSDNEELINSKGVLGKDYHSTSEIVHLTATLSYEDFSADREYVVNIPEKNESETEKIISMLKNYIKGMQTDENRANNLIIPDTIDGYKIYEKGSRSKVFKILAISLVLAVLICLKGTQDIKSKEKKRNSVLLMEYPVLVDMLNLYMGAGLTVKGALSRIADNNETILGEEIRYALNEIKSGVPEGESYYRLGHRLNLPVYLKLMSLLSQNVKKGTRDILDMLMAEEDQALQLRKELAKKKGEEASTKLLFPMILLLATVMLIIVMPVFLSF